MSFYNFKTPNASQIEAYKKLEEKADKFNNLEEGISVETSIFEGTENDITTRLKEKTVNFGQYGDPTTNINELVKDVLPETFKALDTNSDKKLSKEEIKDFANLDGKENSISGSDFKLFEKEIEKQKPYGKNVTIKPTASTLKAGEYDFKTPSAAQIEAYKKIGENQDKFKNLEEGISVEANVFEGTETDIATRLKGKTINFGSSEASATNMYELAKDVLPSTFKALDANADKKLSKEELENFKKLDQNSDNISGTDFKLFEKEIARQKPHDKNAATKPVATPPNYKNTNWTQYVAYQNLKNAKETINKLDDAITVETSAFEGTEAEITKKLKEKTINLGSSKEDATTIYEHVKNILPDTFKVLDANSDKKLSKEELAYFANFDENSENISAKDFKLFEKQIEKEVNYPYTSSKNLRTS